MWMLGGIVSYVTRVMAAQRAAGNEVFLLDDCPAAPGGAADPAIHKVGSAAELFATARALGVDILHLHTRIAAPPPPGMKVVRTVHFHEPYCPSGTQFLFRREKACERTFELATCTKGYLYHRCGSLRPHNLAESVVRFRNERRTLPGIRAFAVSDFMKQRLIDAGYAARDIVMLRPTACESGDYRPAPKIDTPHFVFLGRIVPEKGLGWLLRALARVDAPCHLDIAGDGHMRQRMQDLAADLGIGARVTFHSWVDEHEVQALLERATALVYPSIWQEPSGVAVFEAMAQGRAVIVSKVGGAAEPIDHGVHGLCVESGDEYALAQALRTLATDAALAQKLGYAAWEKARRSLNLQQHIAELDAQYRDVISR
jgi:glycosyltransferase involved in cell wall biosynthesis